MAGLKSITRTVLNTTLSSVTSYSSGQLFVGDLSEFIVDYNVTSATGGSGGSYTFTINRIAPDGTTTVFLNEAIYSGGSTGQKNFMAGAALGNAFGDYIQIDLSIAGGWTISGTVEIAGK